MDLYLYTGWVFSMGTVDISLFVEEWQLEINTILYRWYYTFKYTHIRYCQEVVDVLNVVKDMYSKFHLIIKVVSWRGSPGSQENEMTPDSKKKNNANRRYFTSRIFPLAHFPSPSSFCSVCYGRRHIQS